MFEDKYPGDRHRPAAPQRFPSAASLINAPHAPGSSVQTVLPPTVTPPAGHGMQRRLNSLKSKWDNYLDESVPLQPSVASHTLQIAPSDKLPPTLCPLASQSPVSLYQHPHPHRKRPFQCSSLPLGSHSLPEPAPLQGGGAQASCAQGEMRGHASKRLKQAISSGIYEQRCPDNSLVSTAVCL
eukprot:1136787-Pelagomonas_calceolata.AAC.2